MLSALLVIFAQSLAVGSTSPTPAPPDQPPSPPTAPALPDSPTPPSPPNLASTAALPAPIALGPPPRPPFEFTAQLVMGGGARLRPLLMPEGFFALQWRLDFLFGRSSPRAFGVGPALSVRLDQFSDVAPLLGASLLLPVHEALPIVVTAAGGARWDGVSWAPGFSGRAWWGIRSHNYHGVYVLCVGLWAEARHWVEPQNSTDFAAGIDFDLQALAIPFIALYVELFRRTRNH